MLTVQGGEDFPMMITVFAAFFILAYLAGIWADMLPHTDEDGGRFIFRISFGGCALLLAGMIVSFVCSLFSCSATVCAYVLGLVIVLIIASGAVIQKKQGGPFFTLPVVRGGKGIILWMIAASAVALSVAGVMRYASSSAEAVRGIGAATYVYETSQLSPADPMMLLIGVMSKMLGMHPLSFIFTVSPAVYVVLYQMCYLAVITAVFPEGGRTWTAFAALMALNIWGYRSEAAISVALLVRWFGTGVYFIHGLPGIAAAVLIRYLKNRPPGTEADTDEGDVLTEEWDMKDHKIINARNLAIAVVVLAVVLIAAVFVMNSKINRLYDATVNLQEDLNKRSSVYEQRSDDGSIEGFLIKGSDGNEYVIKAEEMKEE